MQPADPRVGGWAGGWTDDGRPEMWLHGDGGNDLWSGGQMDAWGDRSTNGVTEEVVDGRRVQGWMHGLVDRETPCRVEGQLHG